MPQLKRSTSTPTVGQNTKLHRFVQLPLVGRKPNCYRCAPPKQVARIDLRRHHSFNRKPEKPAAHRSMERIGVVSRRRRRARNGARMASRYGAELLSTRARSPAESAEPRSDNRVRHHSYARVPSTRRSGQLSGLLRLAVKRLRNARRSPSTIAFRRHSNTSQTATCTHSGIQIFGYSRIRVTCTELL
jgi:hypothetical protein